jgi:hypothetical protein
MPAGDLFGEEADGGFTRRGDLTALVFCPAVQVNQVVFAVLVLFGDFTFT